MRPFNVASSPGKTEPQTLATLQKVAADPGIEVTLLEPVQPAPETVPDPKVMGAITDVVHSMWPGVMVLPQMAGGGGGGWNDLNDLRMHGRDERKEIGDFYATVEFTYRLMKKLGTAPSL